MNVFELQDNRSMVVVDVETTGLSPSCFGRVCEVGAVKIKNGRVAGTFQSLVNPQYPMPYGAYCVHGISDEMLEGAPTFREIALSVEEFFEDLPVAAYNAPFDVGFLNNEFSISGSHYMIPRQKAVDILVLSRRYLRGLASYSLPKVARSLNIKAGNAHRALDDARTAWKVFKKIFDVVKKESYTAIY